MALDQSALVEVLDVVVGKEPVPSVPSAGSIRLYPSPKVDRRRWQQRRAEPACWTVFSLWERIAGRPRARPTRMPAPE